MLALVGRSGAGKSTLLKLVNRLLLPDAGAVLVRGTRHARVGADRAAPAASATCCRTSASFRTCPSRTTWRSCRASNGGAPSASRRACTSCSSWSGCRRSEFAPSLARRAVGRPASARRRRARARRRSAGAADGRAVRRARSADARRAAREFRRIQSRLRKTVIIVTHDMGEAFALGRSRRRARGGPADRLRSRGGRRRVDAIRASAACSTRCRPSRVNPIVPILSLSTPADTTFRTAIDARVR